MSALSRPAAGLRRRLGDAFVVLAASLALALPARAQTPDSALARQVEIRRTAHGVPHIRAQNLKAAAYALGWVQVEDYGARVPLGLLKARGEMARFFGRDSIESDFRNRPNWLHAAEVFHDVDQDTRDIYDGFAAGVNRYMQLHTAEFPAGFKADFSGIDALATDMGEVSAGALRRLLQKLGAPAPRVGAAAAAAEGAPPRNPDEGSNAWAFAPSRTKSGKAILLRNPHLSWDAGYYEAQVTVPGVIDFYGDFRIGGPFQTIGGFNSRLGFATTNNYPPDGEV
ncbi:MAG TPA: penicillin acylase family protein, partial [Longimicrobiales bacterium]